MRSNLALGAVVAIAVGLCGCRHDKASTDATSGADPAADIQSDLPSEPQLVSDAPAPPPGLRSAMTVSAVTADRPRFISADPTAPLPVLGRSDASEVAGDEPAPPQPVPGIRTPGLGPMFQTLGQDRIATLNRYRGLQLLDLSNAAAPRVEGELPLNAFGMIALYLAADRALVLVDGYRQYDSASGREQQSSALLSIDVSQPSQPLLARAALLPGLVRASQLVKRDGRAALFVVCDNEAFGAADSSVVKSFDVSAGELTLIRELDLGRGVTAVRAGTDSLLVARLPGGPNAQRGSVSLVDIASSEGEVRLGPDFQLAGYVPSAASMDLYGGILRVLSIGRGSSWENHLETFGVSDRTALVPVAHCEFGAGESLRSAEFAGSRALFVTHDPNAPFHAFTFDAEGRCQPHAYGLLPGSDDIFRFASGGERLIGVTSTEGGMAVTLYDSTDLSEGSPALSRVDFARPAEWSEVSWDVERFRILEDGGAISATPATDDALESGMVLLPYAARDRDHRYLAGVQTLTFSDRTLTRRGAMEHGSIVKQSVAASSDTMLNLSDSELTLFDHQDSASCRELGRLELAPNYSRVFAYGEHLARVHLDSGQLDLGAAVSQSVTVEIVPRSSDPETRAPVASFEVPASANLYQVGSLLVGVTLTGEASEGSSMGAPATPLGRAGELTTAAVEVFDLADPRSPRRAGTSNIELPLRDFHASYGYGAESDSVGLSRRAALVLPNALVLPSAERHEQLRGSRQICITTPDAGCQQVERGGVFVERCFSGETQCVRIDEDPARCLGEIRECDQSFGDCGALQGFAPSSQTCTRDYLQTTWTTLSFHIIDLSDPERPALTRLSMPDSEQGVDVFPAGTSLYYTFKQPVELPEDPRSYAAYYYKRIDLEHPSAPQVGVAINLAGELISVHGANLYARDYAWKPDLQPGHEITLRRLTLAPSEAEPSTDEARHENAVSLGASELSSVSADGAGSLAYVLRGKALVIADPNTLRVQSQVELTGSQRLKALEPGRALLADGGSIAIVDFANPAAASVTVHHLVRGWNSAMAWAGDRVFVAAGPYGLQQFPVISSE